MNIKCYQYNLGSREFEAVSLGVTLEVEVGGIVEDVDRPRGSGGGESGDDVIPHHGDGCLGQGLNMGDVLNLGNVLSNRGNGLRLYGSVVNQARSEVVGVGDPETDSWSSFEFYTKKFSSLVRILPEATSDALTVCLLLIFDTIFLVSVVTEGGALLVSLILQDLDVPGLVLGRCHANYHQDYCLHKEKYNMFITSWNCECIYVF